MSIVSLSSVGHSDPIFITPLTGGSNSTGQSQAGLFTGIGLLVTFDAGSVATAYVDLSADGVHWNAHDTLANLSASTNGNIAYYVKYVRLRLSAWTSGTVTLGVCQPAGG